MSEDEKYESVRYWRYVDYVVDDAPWNIDEEFIKRHLIDFMAHDSFHIAVATKKMSMRNYKRKICLLQQIEPKEYLRVISYLEL